jgi:hypothetical protein
MNFLLANNADAHQIYNHQSALQLIIYQLSAYCTAEEVSVVKSLLVRGAEPNVTWDPYFSRTAILFRVISQSFLELSHILIDYGADTEHLDTNIDGKLIPYVTPYRDLTPLYISIQSLNYEAVKLLLLRGAKLYPFESNFDKTSAQNTSLLEFLSGRIFDATLESSVGSVQRCSTSALRVAEVYREFGGKLHNSSDNNVFKMTAKKLLEHELDVKKCYVDLTDKLVLLMKTPRSLQSFCRVAILNQMGRKFYTLASKLPLPKEIIEYLLTFPVYDDDDDDDDDFWYR